MAEGIDQTQSVLSQKLDEVTLLDDATQQCVRHCLDCFKACEEMIAYGLKKGGQAAAYEHIRTLLDCADACRMCVQLLTRQSTFHPQQCGLCAEICAACAESCDRLARDPLLRACAEICLHSMDSCRRMSGQLDMKPAYAS